MDLQTGTINHYHNDDNYYVHDDLEDDHDNHDDGSNDQNHCHGPFCYDHLMQIFSMDRKYLQKMEVIMIMIRTW